MASGPKDLWTYNGKKNLFLTWNCNIKKEGFWLWNTDLWTKSTLQIFSWGYLLKLGIKSPQNERVQSLTSKYTLHEINANWISVCPLGSGSNSTSCIYCNQSICWWLLRPFTRTCQTQSKWNATGFSIWCDLWSISAGENPGFWKWLCWGP